MSATQPSIVQLTFDELISQHQKVIYGYLLHFTRNAQDAQDLFQETFLRAYRAYAALPADANHRAWLMRIAVNLSKNYVRDRQRHSRVFVTENPDADGQTLDGVTVGTDMESTMISRETAHTLLSAIETLPFHQRAALIQRQFEGLDYQAIAANLQCSAESARAHVYQALRKLRLSLDSSSLDGKKEQLNA